MTDEPDRKEHDPEPERDDPFPGLRPGRMTSRGKVQPHEKATLLKIVPVGLAIVALYAVPKPEAWPGGLTILITVALFTIGVFLLVRGLARP